MITGQKAQKGRLDAEPKEYNRALSAFHVGGENKIRQLKRFNILSYRDRNLRTGSGLKFNIIAGMVNLKAGF